MSKKRYSRILAASLALIIAGACLLSVFSISRHTCVNCPSPIVCLSSSLTRPQFFQIAQVFEFAFVFLIAAAFLFGAGQLADLCASSPVGCKVRMNN